VGSTIIAYLTGSGPVSPAQSDGVPAQTDTLVNMTSPHSAQIGSATAQVQFAGMAPGFIGLVQVNIVVPQLAPGTYPLTITVGGETSNSATIAVK
jgi:adhesin/invasin